MKPILGVTSGTAPPYRPWANTTINLAQFTGGGSNQTTSGATSMATKDESTAASTSSTTPAATPTTNGSSGGQTSTEAAAASLAYSEHNPKWTDQEDKLLYKLYVEMGKQLHEICPNFTTKTLHEIEQRCQNNFGALRRKYVEHMMHNNK